jgi:hypothetical protein
MKNKVYISKSEQEKKEISSKTIMGIMFTDKAVKALYENYKMKLDELTDKELKNLLNKAEHDEKIITADSGDAVWIKDDMEAICCTDDMDNLYKIEELKLYTAKYPPNEGGYSIYGKFGDTSKFLRHYLMIIDYQDEKSCNRIFEDNLNCIFWHDKDNELKEAVEKQLEKVKKDTLEDEVLMLQGETFDSLEMQIELFAGSEDEYEFKGLAYGKRVYRIKDKIYYLSSISGRYAGTYYWILQELGQKGYEYFGNR